VKVLGFGDIVAMAWSSALVDTDLFCVLDHKLHRVAIELHCWSSMKIGSI
jgi:hypothetical protein